MCTLQNLNTILGLLANGLVSFFTIHTLVGAATVTTEDEEDSDITESKLTGLPTVMISIKDNGEEGDWSKGTNSSSVFPSEDLPGEKNRQI